jgi:glycosyltransferase involved in cell wall biosynthesis
LPAISVIMPVYNRAGSVREAIDSVLAQDFEDFELIVVDDGSRDGTAEVIEAVGDPRIRCLRQSRNQGGNAARNRGIREARSPLICFLDSDDQFLPHKLGFVVAFFARNPEIDVLTDSFRLVYPPESGKPPADRLNPDLHSSAEIERAVFSRRLFKATPALSARRAALEAVGLFDETLKRRQDMDLVLRLARGARCAATSEVLWTKRWSADSISAKQNTFATAMIEMCARHPDYLARPEFRIGLARDMARHFLRLLATGHVATAGENFRRCAGFFGWGQMARLLGAGLAEMLRRAVTRREV